MWIKTLPTVKKIGQVSAKPNVLAYLRGLQIFWFTTSFLFYM